MDALDFIDLLNHPKMYSDIRFVYITLSIWSISCLQFTAQITAIEKILLKRKFHRLAAIMTYSLISMIIMDIPYIIIRLYVIFGIRNHEYTSYFLVFKNIIVIALQTTEVWVNFNETTRKRRVMTIV